MNLETSGYKAEQIVFTGLSLTRDQLLHLGLTWRMKDVGGGSGVEPPAYEENWGAD